MTPGKEAALGPDHLAVLLDDLRVDEDAEIARLVLGRTVDDEDPRIDTDLVGGEAAARGCVHRLCHVVDQRLNLGRDGGNRLGGLAQARVGVLEDFAIWP